MKTEKMVKRQSFGSAMRKRLSDITNLHSLHKSPAKFKENLPATVDESPTKDYIEQLVKENAVLMKHIQERDNMIESMGQDMQNLTTRLQKAQLQNWNLAQSNSHMLAELNLGKDRLKALQHELACKDALYKAKVLELEVREAATKKVAAENSLKGNIDNENKLSKTKRRRPCPARSRSMGSVTSQQAGDKEMAETKRRCLRRQSVRLKPPSEPQADLFEIEVANFPIGFMDESAAELNSDMLGNEEGIRRSSNASERQRLSIGRPIRRATEKVQSYKEVPVNLKMRRPE